MGQVTAATMLAETAEDRARFPTADVLLAETGTAPVTRSSGRSRTVRFRYAANKRMRHAVDWWAFVAVRENRLGARRLPASSRPRAAAQPRTARHRRPLDTHPVAVLERPHDLRSRTAPEEPERLRDHRLTQAGAHTRERRTVPRARSACPRTPASRRCVF